MKELVKNKVLLNFAGALFVVAAIATPVRIFCLHESFNMVRTVFDVAVIGAISCGLDKVVEHFKNK